jgi:uncharacterized protein YbjT (DUF2867 family)
VMGATGRQGGAVIQALLAREKEYLQQQQQQQQERGGATAGDSSPSSPPSTSTSPPHIHWRIVALTRDPTQASAQALRDAGCIVERADPNVLASMTAALTAHAPVYAMFCVTNPFTSRWGSLSRPSSTSTDLEYTQGINAIAAAQAGGVRHFIHSSVASAHDSDPDGKGHVEILANKARIEGAVAASGLPHSTLCPVGFFEMLLSSFAGLKQGLVPGLVREGVNVQMMSYVDVGVFVRMMLEDPEAWMGKRLEVAGDLTNSWAMAETLGRLRGGEKWGVRAPPEFLLKLFIPKAFSRM